MKISARTDYACRAVLELAMNWPNKEPVQIEQIAKKQNVPMKYLVHILLQLKQAGIVQSIRGKEGGYILAKQPSKISLCEIIREVGGPLVVYANKKDIFSSIWVKVEEEMSKILDNITFEYLADQAKALKQEFIYII
jgi:Rrf2 family protein